MSFGGFTNFAKNALLTAQKHIDSALHIEEDEYNGDENELEDDETEREDNNLFDSSTSLYQSAILVIFLN